MKFGDRLKLVRGNLKQDEFAEKTGCHKSTIGRWERGEQFPDIDDANKILKAFPDISPAWLLADEGAMLRGAVVEEHVAYTPERHVELQVYALAGAGHPNSLLDTEPVAQIAVPKDFYRPSIVPVQIRGRSMEETIMDGAIVGVDREDKWVVSGEIYAVWMPYEGAVVKRLYLDTEKITCRSDNTKFTDIIVPLDRIDENFIQGRVKWVIQRY